MLSISRTNILFSKLHHIMMMITTNYTIIVDGIESCNKRYVKVDDIDSFESSLNDILKEDHITNESKFAHFQSVYINITDNDNKIIIQLDRKYSETNSDGKYQRYLFDLVVKIYDVTELITIGTIINVYNDDALSKPL